MPGSDCYSPPLVLQTEAIAPRTVQRFTINSLWVDARTLPSGSLAVRSRAFNPQLRDLFSQLARQYGGYYKKQYTNWIYPEGAAEAILLRLSQLQQQGMPNAVVRSLAPASPVVSRPDGIRDLIAPGKSE